MKEIVCTYCVTKVYQSVNMEYIERKEKLLRIGCVFVKINSISLHVGVHVWCMYVWHVGHLYGDSCQFASILGGCHKPGHSSQNQNHGMDEVGMGLWIHHLQSPLQQGCPEQGAQGCIQAILCCEETPQALCATCAAAPTPTCSDTYTHLLRILVTDNYYYPQNYTKSKNN